MIKIVAYLAPEIPSLSATFVYNEILALQARGIEVIPISVHHPGKFAKTPEIESLLHNTVFLYTQRQTTVLNANFSTLVRTPVRYLSTLGTVCSDVMKGDWQTGVKLFYQFWQASQVAHLLAMHGCQHLHIHFAHVPTQIGMYASLLSGVPFTFTSHANDLFERGSLLQEKVGRSHAAVTISEYNCGFLKQQGVDPAKLTIVRCGIDTSKYAFSPPPTVHTPPVLGSLARLVEKKGIDTLILAVQHLHQQGQDFRLEICGDGPLLGELKQLVTHHHLDDKIIFKGSMAHHEVFPWMKTLDLFVLPCKRDSQGDQDGIPVVLMEAMAVGTPVVSTEISGIPELIQTGVSGFLAQPNDPIDLATTLQAALSLSQSERQGMAEAARQRIVDEFDQTVNADRLLNLFN